MSSVQNTGLSTGFNRPLLSGLSLERPADIVPTLLTNAVERASGVRDDRAGRALMQLGLGSVQLVQAGLRSAAQGSGALAASSSFLGKIIPLVSIGSGAAQVVSGWSELRAHGGSLSDILTSKTARTGLLQVAAGALLFLPGIGSALGGAGLRIAAAANELDYFSFLDNGQRVRPLSPLSLVAARANMT